MSSVALFKKNLSILLLFFVILLAALAMRVPSLWIPHWRGDQGQYIILAMKLDRFGLDGYNLRQVQMGEWVFPQDPRFKFTVLKDLPEDAPGSYLQIMKQIGQGYYDEPLHVRAPLFPAILMVSHRIFSPDQPMAVLSSAAASAVSQKVLWMVVRSQFWASIIPIFFSVGIVAITAALAWLWTRCLRTAIYSAVLMATNPLSIWLAHRVLNESAAVFFVILAFLALGDLKKKYSPLLSAVCGAGSGFFIGLAVLVNQRMLLAAAAIGLIVWIRNVGEGLGSDKPGLNRRHALLAIRALTQPFFAGFILVFVATTWFWFYRVFEVYGDILHQPLQGMQQGGNEDITGWFAAVRARPHPLIFFAVGVPLMFPLFFFAYATWARFWRGLTGFAADPASRHWIALWIWILMFYRVFTDITRLFGTGGIQEHRYFYAVYPAIAILSACALNGLRTRVMIYTKRAWAASGLMVLLLTANAAWGAWQAYAQIFNDSLLF